MSKISENIETISTEIRVFHPSKQFSQKAHIASMEEYQTLYDKSIREPEKFWDGVAGELTWFKKWDKVLDSSDPAFCQWFVNGKTNIAFNCLDRHLDAPTRNKAALIWEGEPRDKRTLTYAQLAREVNLFANALKNLGLNRGDRVAIYLTMIPELVVSLLACARIGAVHSVIFAGFSAEAIRERVLDSGAQLVITADGGWRKGNLLPLKNIVDEALQDCACVKHVVVVKRAVEGTFELKRGDMLFRISPNDEGAYIEIHKRGSWNKKTKDDLFISLEPFALSLLYNYLDGELKDETKTLSQGGRR